MARHLVARNVAGGADLYTLFQDSLLSVLVSCHLCFMVPKGWQRSIHESWLSQI